MSKSSDGSSARARRSVKTRHVAVAAGILVLGISPFAVAQGTGALRAEVRNGTFDRETEIIANEAASTAKKGGYATRQSNLSNSGGGAIYGCRSTPETAANQPKAPCIRSNNLSTGLAFEFNAQRGDVVGAFTAGSGGDSKKPFVTNATGVATGLNADELDGLDAKQITDLIGAAAAAAAKDATDKSNAARERWVTVRETGSSGAEIVAQSGGFSLVNCYSANGNCYIDAGSDVTKKAVHSSILTVNDEDAGTAGNQAPPGDDTIPAGDDDLAGISSASPCGFASVNCAPPGTEANNVFVVTPRNDDGTPPAAGERYSFTAYVSAASAP